MSFPRTAAAATSFAAGSPRPMFFARGGSLGNGRALFAATASSTARGEETATSVTETDHNPLLSDWSKEPYHLPPFAVIQPHHFEAALENAMQEHLAELQAIVDQPSEPPSLENTIIAYDRSGYLLERVSAVFSNLCSSQNVPELQAVELKMAPKLSRHASATFQLPGLFDRIRAVYEQRTNTEHGWTSEQERLVERVYMDFTRAGAALPRAQQEELAQLQAQLATLHTTFSQNVMADETAWGLVVTKDDLEGCPDGLLEAAKSAASERGKVKEDDKPDGEVYVLTLSRSMVEPFLTFAKRRDLRQKLFEAWVSRGQHQNDNIAVATEILKLRQRVAKIHGYPNFAAYQCADRMAQTPEKVQELLEKVWYPAREAAQRERQSMEAFLAKSGETLEGGLQPWDWRYYAEQVRIADYDLDETLLKPYFSLNAVREALFAVSGNLFGLEYKPRSDIQAYHPDVDVYEVWENVKDASSDNTSEEKKLVALFLHDNYARAHKNGGAWMSEYRSQSRNLKPGVDPIEQIPIVVNNNNFAKGSQETTLLSYDDARTMFHEFGHGHHGMLSNANYQRLASTNVLTDFVELPSQLFEHWLGEPSVMKQYCKHYQTGEPIPDELLQKLKAARNFQQGFQTIEYTICALLDMAVHQIDDYDNFDMNAFETSELERLGMPQGIVMRHRPAHFLHLFSTSMYAAGYYVYLWAEVLDADAFAAFTESGNIFDPEVANRARTFIYSAGNTVAPDELFRRFRGRDPDIQYMLKKKGLVGDECDATAAK